MSDRCYKLTYFNLRGRGELCRYVLLAAGQEFHDVRIDFEKEWLALKPSIPFGQLPVLDVDGDILVQSGAIARYMAREFKLTGKDSWEQALCDQYICMADEMLTEFIEYIHILLYDNDEQKQKDRKKKLNEERFPKFLAQFESCLEKNGGDFFVGDSLSVADLAIYDACDNAVIWNATIIESYPKLQANRANVEAISKIGEYIKTRKPLEFF